MSVVQPDSGSEEDDQEVHARLLAGKLAMVQKERERNAEKAGPDVSGSSSLQGITPEDIKNIANQYLRVIMLSVLHVQSDLFTFIFISRAVHFCHLSIIMMAFIKNLF